MAGVLSFMLLCAASVLFYGSDRPRGTARLRQLQALPRARWLGAAAVGCAFAIELSQGTSLPVAVLSTSLGLMVTLTLVTLAFAMAAADTAKAAHPGPAKSKPRAASWRARAEVTARTLAAAVGSMLAAFFCSAVLMRFLPTPPPTRFAIAMLLAIPLWALGICLCFVAASALRAWVWCGGLGAGLALFLHWMAA